MKTDNSEAANRKCTAFDYMKVKKKIYDKMYKKQSQKKTEWKCFIHTYISHIHLHTFVFLWCRDVYISSNKLLFLIYKEFV